LYVRKPGDYICGIKRPLTIAHRHKMIPVYCGIFGGRKSWTFQRNVAIALQSSAFVIGCCLSSVYVVCLFACNASVLWQNNCKYDHAVFTAKQLRVSTVSKVRCMSANMANSAIHSLGVDKWVVSWTQVLAVRIRVVAPPDKCLRIKADMVLFAVTLCDPSECVRGVRADALYKLTLPLPFTFTK